MKPGTWPQDCRQRAFVEGAARWMYYTTGCSPWSDERTQMENEAVKRFGQPPTETLERLTSEPSTGVSMPKDRVLTADDIAHGFSKETAK